jgi:hypothetical protein
MCVHMLNQRLMLVYSVQTDGINIDEMLQYDKILDLRRLSCNNVHVMARYLFVPLHPPPGAFCVVLTLWPQLGFFVSVFIIYGSASSIFPKILEPDPNDP